MARAFELDPSAPVGAGAPEPRAYAERLAAKYGTSRAHAQQMIDRMVETARADGEHRRMNDLSVPEPEARALEAR